METEGHQDMKHSLFETTLGALVLVIAGVFLVYGARVADIGSGAGADTYRLCANFVTVGALKSGDAVRISGVKVGVVEAIVLNPKTYAAQVTMVLPNLPEPLPSDSSAAILSEGLMGGVTLALTPGGDEETLPSGGRIAYTQEPQNLEQLLGKFIFSMQEGKKDAL